MRDSEADINQTVRVINNELSFVLFFFVFIFFFSVLFLVLLYFSLFWNLDKKCDIMSYVTVTQVTKNNGNMIYYRIVTYITIIVTQLYNIKKDSKTDNII